MNTNFPTITIFTKFKTHLVIWGMEGGDSEGSDGGPAHEYTREILIQIFKIYLKKIELKNILKP